MTVGCDVTVLDLGENTPALSAVMELLDGDGAVQRADRAALSGARPPQGADLGVLIVPLGTPAADPELDAYVGKMRQSGAYITVLGVAAECAVAAKVPLGGTFDEIVSLEWLSAPYKIRRFVHRHSVGQRRQAVDTFLDCSLDGFWYCDFIANKMEWSQRHCEIVGIPMDMAPKDRESFFALVHPADVARVEGAMHDHIKHKVPYRDVALRLRRHDGSYGNFVANGKAVVDATGRPVFASGSISDLTLLQRVERELEDTSRRFQVLFHRMNDAAILADIETGLVMEANEPAERLWGKPLAELIGSHQASLHPPTLTVAAQAIFQDHVDALMRDQRDSMEVPILRKDGIEVPTEISSSLLEIGGRKMILGVFRDITERRLADRALRERDAQLHLASHLASMGTLAAGVAHEINNPLTYMLGNLELLRDSLAGIVTQRPDLSEAFDAAMTGGRYLREIVTDLKAISQVDEAEGGCDPCEVLRVASRMAMSDLRHRAVLQSDLVAVPRVPLPPARLTQVLLNILSNSARSFGTRDRLSNLITIRTELVDGGVQIVLADNGSGIAPLDLRRVFEPFFSRNQRNGGTGLGLSICRRIVEEVGGTISITSELGVGTTVTLLLPVVSVPGAPDSEGDAKSPPAAAPKQDAGKASLMIIDDDPLVSRLIEQFLRKHHDVTVFNDARRALEALQASPDRWALVLCDLMMPDLNGAALFAAVEEMPGPHPEFLFITGGAVTEDCIVFEQRMSREGRVLLKPFEAATLRARVGDLLAEQPSHAPASVSPGVPVAEVSLPETVATPTPSQGELVADADVVAELEDTLGPEVLTQQYRRLRADLDVAAANIASAVVAGDINGVRMAAHKVAGAAAFLGLPELVGLLRVCEEAATAGNLGHVRASLPGIESAAGRLSDMIARRELAFG